MSPVTFEVVTPERKILKEEVESVIAPGAEGYLGVLPRHTPLPVSYTHLDVYKRQG